MWPYLWTHVGTPSHPRDLDWLTVTLPSEATAGAAEGAPELGQWEGQDVPLVISSSRIVKGGIRSSQRYQPTSSGVGIQIIQLKHKLSCGTVLRLRHLRQS